MSNKVRIELELIREHSFFTENTRYYGDDGFRTVYTFRDELGKIYTWFTSKVGALSSEEFDDNGDIIDYTKVRLGGRVILRGTVIGEEEYNGVIQTKLNRCKLEAITYMGPTEEEYIEMKRDEQLKGRTNYSIKHVRYSDYKNNYSDCEILYESFERTNTGCFIDIIV